MQRTFIWPATSTLRLDCPRNLRRFRCRARQHYQRGGSACRSSWTRNSVIQADLDESVETVIAGAQRKNAVLSAKEKEIVAYHEIGHALVAAKQTDSAPVTKITIVPRTSGALGYTMQVDEGEHNADEQG